MMKMFITMQRQVQLNLYLSCSSICSNTYATCFCPCGAECRILVPWPRNGIYAPAVEAWWLSNWTTTLNHFTTYTTHFHDHTFKIQLVEQLLSLSLSLFFFFTEFSIYYYMFSFQMNFQNRLYQTSKKIMIRSKMICTVVIFI